MSRAVVLPVPALRPGVTAPGLRRRTAVLAGLGLALPMLSGAQTHAGMGPVEPRLAAPGLALTLHSGRAARLPDLLRGQITALQLMFTGCGSTCPIQGVIFSSLQSSIAHSLPQAQMLSLSIAPLNDDARALANWLQRFGAGPRWQAAVPAVRDGDVMLDFLAGRRKPGQADRHTPQVYLFDRQGRLAYRCAELASSADISKLMVQLARIG